MINVAAIALVLLMTLRNEPSITVIFVELGFMGILASWMVFNSIRRLRRCVREMFETYELEIDDRGVAARRNDLPATRIDFADITRIEEVEGFWLTVIGRSAKQRIGIPRQLIGFDEVAERLRVYSPIEKKKYPSYRIYAALPFLATYGVALWSHTPLLVLLTCIAMWGFLGWALIYVQRSPIFLKRTKRTMWFAVFPIATVIPRFLWAIEQLRK